MDQKDISRLKYSKCCAAVGNNKCSREGSRSLSSTVIEKIRSMGYDHQLDESMRICVSCQTVISHSRSVPQKSDDRMNTKQRKISMIHNHQQVKVRKNQHANVRNHQQLMLSSH